MNIIKFLSLFLPFLFAVPPLEANVAIFDGGVDFPYYGAPDTLIPKRILATLEEIGINAQILDETVLADPERFNAQSYAVLIHIYGNTFPLVAAENIRKFHREGGSILATGVPFTHPCIATGVKGWNGIKGDAISLTEQARTGSYALKIAHEKGRWSGPVSERIPVSDAKAVKHRYRISGWSLANDKAQGDDFLFVRFFDSSGAFLGQQGPGMLASQDWLKISAEVDAPEGAKWLDASPQVWTKGVKVILDDISLVDLQSGEEVLKNGGFEGIGGEWKDLGHTNEWLYYREGIGLGGFRGPVASANSTVRLETDDPLSLGGLGVPAELRRSAQWLDASSLQPGASVEGTFGVYEGDELRGYTAAIIRTPQGSTDMWAGSTPGIGRLYDEFLMRQIFARGVVNALTESGIWTETQREGAFRKLDKMPQPKSRDELTPPNEPRPYLTFFPKPPRPAETLLVADVRNLPPDEKLLLTSLQGLVNRKRPQIYLIFNNHDRRWLDWLKHTGRVQSEEIVKEPLSLIKRFSDSFHGAVIPDMDLYIGVVIACNVAGANDLLIASERLVSQHDLKIQHDLRGRFSDNASALKWVEDNLLDQLSHHLLICSHPDLAYNGSFDYIIQHRGIAFWLAGRIDGRRDDSDAIAEQKVIESIFAKLPVNVPVRGFWWHGHGVGPGEGPGVTLGSRFGKVTVVSDGIANLSVHSGYTIKNLKQTTQPPAPQLEQDRVYLAFTMSDGDNLNTLYGYFTSYFEDNLHGKFPMGWGVGPTIIDLAPAVIEWYYENASATDEFFCDVSGIGYIYPRNFGENYLDREAVMDGFLSWTQKYMDRLDMNTIRPMGVDESNIHYYGKHLEGLHSLFPDYGRATGGDLDRATYMLPNGIPVFRGFTDWREDHPDLAQYMADQITRQVGEKRPAFVNVFIWNWGYRLETLKRVLDLLPADFVPVTPAQLAQLYRGSQID